MTRGETISYHYLDSASGVIGLVYPKSVAKLNRQGYILNSQVGVVVVVENVLLDDRTWGLTVG